MDDPAIDAFTCAQGDRRVRGAFRLVGIVAAVAIAFVLSLGQLEVFHEGVYLVYPVPVVVCWLLGELAVGVRRELRARNPRIPQARLLR